MDDPKRIYELLLDYANSNTQVTELSIGLVWTVCKAQHTGLAMSPGTSTRTLPWSGTVAGKTLGELASWITDWEPYKATIAMAAINCSLNRYELPSGITLMPAADNANLAVFDYFLPQLQGKKVVVVGRYPGIETYAGQYNLSIIEKQPVLDDYPDAASEFLLPEADWVFLTASSITNKTFPRLAKLAENATTVLMGPTVPWLPQLHEFGINYLAGVEVINPEQLYQTVTEGGGVRIFDNAVRYRIVELSPDNSMAWLKAEIGETFSEKQQLNEAMEAWYASGKKARFPSLSELDQVTTKLSRMDSSYKKLWDENTHKTLTENTN